MCSTHKNIRNKYCKIFYAENMQVGDLVKEVAIYFEDNINIVLIFLCG